MANTFAQLLTRDSILGWIEERGYQEPTPVQEVAIPAILEGKDVIAESPTGTGKTMAYLLPLCEKLDPASKDLQVLVLAPTHELVMQIYREAESLLGKLGINALALIGGVDTKRQVEKLKTHPAIVIATPGKAKELLDLRKLKVHAVKSVVIDEADRLMDKGFAAPVQDVMKRTMRDTQRLFFSATLPQEMVNLLATMTNEPTLIKAEKPAGGHEVLHFYLVSEPRKKAETLRRLIRLIDGKKTIVFVNTIDRVDEIKEKLAYHNLDCRLLHRETAKEERAKSIADFRDGKFPVLIVTDIAARGLDIPDVETIIHHDPAADADAYVHRSGRTGRMGAAGLVFSVITPNEQFILKKFMRETGLVISERYMSHGALVDPKEQHPNDVRRREAKLSTGPKKRNS